jgi:hypothetical protein
MRWPSGRTRPTIVNRLSEEQLAGMKPDDLLTLLEPLRPSARRLDLLTNKDHVRRGKLSQAVGPSRTMSSAAYDAAGQHSAKSWVLGTGGGSHSEIGRASSVIEQAPPRYAAREKGRQQTGPWALIAGADLSGEARRLWHGRLGLPDMSRREFAQRGMRPRSTALAISSRLGSARATHASRSRTNCSSSSTVGG